MQADPPARMLTDTNGLVTATNLEEGSWNWQVIAPKRLLRLNARARSPSWRIKLAYQVVGPGRSLTAAWSR